MKFPYAMLRDFVETELNAEQIGDLLTMAGFELEGIEEIDGDHVLDIKVMSNRGDGLSVFGLAREVLAKDGSARPTALYEQAVARFPQSDSFIALTGRVSIETEDCTRFACRFFANLPPGQTPDWIAARLNQAGMRPISLMVDLTNYVMLEVGQPLHAYDLETLAGQRIVVRKARPGEKLTTLNGIEHDLREDQMMICDAEKPIGAAGVMGGLDTEVASGTKTVLLEAAHFVNTSVRRTRKQMGLNTEASYRFERSVDPEGVVAALNRVKMLLEEALGASYAIDGIEDVYPTKPTPRRLDVRMSRVVRLLGMDVSATEAHRYLEALGFDVQGSGEPFHVTAPTWRPDIQREDDVVEEIGRVHGFDRIPETLPVGATTQGGQSSTERAIDRIRERLRQAGFSQCMSHSLRDEHPLDREAGRVGPRVPASPEHALLRNSVLPSLADAARRNGGRDIHLFEVGRIFWQDGGYQERRDLGLLSQGQLFPPNRAKEPVPMADFFSMKGVLQTLGPALEFRTPPEPDPRFHPTRQALVLGIGVLGEIHPDIAEEIGLPAGTVMAELNAEALAEKLVEEVHYRPISRNPSVRRDIAFVVDKSMPYSQLENAIKLACGEELEKHWLFDVYEGTGIPEGKHSLGIALQLRKFGENFTDEEANQVREKAVAALEVLGASMRR
jgi:phenylalanyl-tRNA synthetase beta chain